MCSFINNNNNESQTLKGDVFFIDEMFGKEDIKFSSKKIEIEKGNTLYLFTDGFTDQFGGEKNTKFLSGRFEKLVVDFQKLDMEQQKKLITTFDNWKESSKHIDGICIIGIKI